MPSLFRGTPSLGLVKVESLEQYIKELGREQRSEGRLFQTKGSRIDKALFCNGGIARKWHHKVTSEAEQRDRRSQQAKVQYDHVQYE